MTGTAAPAVPTPGGDGRATFLARHRPPWSKVAALRALRATIVIPAVFAVTSQVIANPQISLFATFGGFATLVLASFAGDRPQKLAAHLALGVVGSVLIPLATVARTSTAAVALVALPVVFCVIYSGATGWNAANGSAAALLTYILPAASPGTVGMIPDRLAGWWLATAAGTLAVLVLSPRPGPNQLRAAARAAAGTLAAELEKALDGVVDVGRCARIFDAGRSLSAAFTAAPYRPTGLTIADQAVGRLVEGLRWCVMLASDLLREGVDLSAASSALAAMDRRRIEASARVLRRVTGALAGTSSVPTLAPLDGCPEEPLRGATEDPIAAGRTMHAAFYASMLIESVGAVAHSTRAVLEATDRGSPSLTVGAWVQAMGSRVKVRASAAAHDLRGQFNIHSVWVRNGARGAVAVAAAIAIADVANVDHGFWVVLGTLGVLRTSAASTGANAWWALLGTVAGVAIGAGLVVGIGDGSAALWAAFVLAVLVAAYAPGVLPFPTGQAAFTVLLLVLYNLIAPTGWTVGVVRVEDIGIGVGISALVGLLFWPRGGATAVAEDVADALHRGGMYLVQATSWALGTRAAPPGSTAVVQASERLDDATRSWLSEQNARRVPKEEVWGLVGGVMRLRLTAASLAAWPTDPAPADAARYELLHESVQVAGVCDDLATTLGRVEDTVVRELAGLSPALGGAPASQPRLLWVREHLDHARGAVVSMVEPAQAVAQARRRPWWR